MIVTRQGKGSFVADTQELPRQLAQQEFDTHLAGLVAAANKLGLSAQDILHQVRNALSAEAPVDHDTTFTNTGNKR